MLRKLVRSYFRIRYFPRLLVQMLTSIQTELARQRALPPQEPAAETSHELLSFLDASTRYMMASTARSSEQDTRLTALQLGLQRLEHHVVGTHGALRDTLATVAQDTTQLRSGQAKLQGDMDRSATETHEHRLTNNPGQALDSLKTDIAALHSALHALAAGEQEHATDVRRCIDAMQHEIGALRSEIAAINGRLHGTEGEDTAGRATLMQMVQHQAARTDKIERMVSQQIRLFPSLLWEPDTAATVRTILAFLKPVAAQGVAKRRLGRDHDGGYVMLDDFKTIGGALSLGIADDVSWDLEMAERGIEVFQFDPSVAGPPETHDKFHFEPLLVVPADVEGGVSLQTILDDRVKDADAALLLKIDIEGSEWDVFQKTSEHTLSRFRQIVCEFHDLERLVEPAFGRRAKEVFAKLAATHAVVHVHGNNCGNFANVGNVMVPQSMEVSFALRSAYRFTDNTTTFPTALDRPNQPGRADLFLGSFDFGE